MKNPRDIVLVGIGFLLGIVFCYFLTASGLVEPKTGGMTVVYSPASQVTNVPAAREINLFPKKADGVRVEDPMVRWTRPRYVPVRRVDNMFRVDAPGSMAVSLGVQYDLIDFNYVPDFKLPAD